MKEAAQEFIMSFMTALSNCTLYSKDHPAVIELSEKAVAVISPLLQDRRLDIALLGDRLVFDNAPIQGESIHTHNLVKRLRRKGVDKIVLDAGLTASELREFITEMGLSGRLTRMYPHIATGVIEVRLAPEESDAAALMNENTEKIREIYQGVSRFRQLDMMGIEDVVVRFLSALRMETNILKVLRPVKSHSEYTYTHNANVSILSMFLAEAVGFGPELIHDVGISGLVHDVGKIFVSREIIDKQTKLDPAEWEEMKKHPVHGARYLGTMHDVPDIAMIVAYEHHMKFDGSGYPSPKKKNWKQHIVSQVIALADFFDALRTERSYRAGLDFSETVELLREGAGRDFNPLIVSHFVKAAQRVTGA